MITLDDIPDRAGVPFEDEDSRIILLMPRYPTFAGRLLGRMLHRSSNIRVKLDELGSAVWSLIDGHKTVRELGEELACVFGSSVDPVYPRLVEFLEILERNKFLRVLESCEVSDVD